MGHLLKFKALGNLGVGPEHTFPFGIFLFEFLALFANSLLDNVFKSKSGLKVKLSYLNIILKNINKSNCFEIFLPETGPKFGKTEHKTLSNQGFIPKPYYYKPKN